MKTAFKRNFTVGNDEKIRKFAAAIGDWNPLHHDQAAARRAGLRGIIAPGVMLVGFLSSVIASEIPRVMIADLNLKFRRPLYSGSHPTVFCTVSRQRDRLAFVTVKIENGAELVAEGSCTLLLPRE